MRKNMKFNSSILLRIIVTSAFCLLYFSKFHSILAIVARLKVIHYSSFFCEHKTAFKNVCFSVITIVYLLFVFYIPV